MSSLDSLVDSPGGASEFRQGWSKTEPLLGSEQSIKSPGGAAEFRQGCSETEPLLGKERVYRAPSGRWNILRAGL